MKNYMQANRFLQKYGPDAFKIIDAYEEAADIPPNAVALRYPAINIL